MPNVLAEYERLNSLSTAWKREVFTVGSGLVQTLDEHAGPRRQMRGEPRVKLWNLATRSHAPTFDLAVVLRPELRAVFGIEFVLPEPTLSGPMLVVPIVLLSKDPAEEMQPRVTHVGVDGEEVVLGRNDASAVLDAVHKAARWRMAKAMNVATPDTDGIGIVFTDSSPPGLRTTVTIGRSTEVAHHFVTSGGVLDAIDEELVRGVFLNGRDALYKQPTHVVIARLLAAGVRL